MKSLRRLVLACACVFYFASSVIAQEIPHIPNLQSVVAQVAAQHPTEWYYAHRRGTGREYDFIKILARVLHTQYDARFGGNYKRDGDELSMDVVTFRVGPTDRHVLVFDVILGAGADNARPTWHNITNFTPPYAYGQPDSARYWDPTKPVYQVVDPNVALSEVQHAFQERFARNATDVELAALVAEARRAGWASGLIPRRILNHLLDLIARYSGDISNPFPDDVPVDPIAALAELQQSFYQRFNRQFDQYEQQLVIDQAYRLGWTGGVVTRGLVNQLHAFIATYEPVERDTSDLTIDGKQFMRDGRVFEWRGITSFTLFYDFKYRRAQYEASVDFYVEHGITVPRVSVAMSTEYLQLVPRSGLPFGLGMTKSWGPWEADWDWNMLRMFVRDLNARGLTPELVVFGTAGPLDHSIALFQSEAGRMQFLEAVATNLLSERGAFIEIANEYNFVGFNVDGVEINRLRERYKQIDPTRLVAPSAPAHNPVIMATGDYMTVHPKRSLVPLPYYWIFEMYLLPHHAVNKPLINDESINADTIGDFGNDPDPRNSWAAGVTTQILNMHYTFHYDRALFGLLPIESDSSLPCLQAWTQGLRDVPFMTSGAVFSAVQSGVLAGDSVFATSGRAVAVIGRHDNTTGYVMFYGTDAAFELPQIRDGWDATLIRDVGTHRVYQLSRVQ